MLDVPGPELPGSRSSSCTTGFYFRTGELLSVSVLACCSVCCHPASSPGQKGCEGKRSYLFVPVISHWCRDDEVGEAALTSQPR